MRTIRVPDDGRTYPLPPGLGPFPVAEVAGARHPHAWQVPMLQSEAMWIDSAAPTRYPFRIRIVAGSIDAASGAAVEIPAEGPPGSGFVDDPQGFVVIPRQR